MNITTHQFFDEKLQFGWNALLAESITHVPFLRFEYLRAWWKHLGGGEWGEKPGGSTQLAPPRLTIVTLSDSGQLVAIAPLFHASHEERPALLLLGSIEISDYLDLIVRQADLQPFLTALLPFLASDALPDWEAVDLYNLLESSPTIPALQETAARMGWKTDLQPLQPAPAIPLPGDWEKYLAGIDKKQRHEIRRKMRRLEESGTPWRWYFAEDPDALEEEIHAFLELMGQDAEKASFLTPSMREMLLEAARCAFSAGCLKLAFLEIDGNKAAAYLNFDYLNRVWVYNSGLERSMLEHSPGWVLLGHLLKWANENRRVEFDFMRGGEDYKYRFGGIPRRVMRLTITR